MMVRWPPLEQFEDDGTPIITELLMKCFVNRFFALPEDWDEDDVPTIMLFVRCKACESVQEYHVKEDELNIIYGWEDAGLSYVEGAENFLYNIDNTYTSLSGNIMCGNCLTIWTYYREKISDLAISAIQSNNPHLKFDSKLEVLFWKAWKEISDISLTVQHQIGRYRVDFAHLPTKTVIEIDGEAYHSTPKQISDDRRRQIEMEQKGWKFLRFSEHDVVFNTERCALDALNCIKMAMKA